MSAYAAKKGWFSRPSEGFFPLFRTRSLKKRPCIPRATAQPIWSCRVLFEERFLPLPPIAYQMVWHCTWCHTELASERRSCRMVHPASQSVTVDDPLGEASA